MFATEKLQSKTGTCFLKDLVRIQPGYFSRSKIRASTNGTHFLIQARDVSRVQGISLDQVIRFRPERCAGLYQVSQGDILLAARGQDRFAFLVTEHWVDVLVSSAFYILRPDTSLVRPVYLAWWLNLPDIQSEIQGHSRGTGIGYLCKRALERVRVDLPNQEVQEKIEVVNALWRKQQGLQKQLNHKREQLIHAVCRQGI